MISISIYKTELYKKQIQKVNSTKNKIQKVNSCTKTNTKSK